MRTGTVIDLKIQKGKIIARVQGTRKTPYRVEIRISPLTEQKCEAILDRCGKIETLERLLSGDFPDEMKELFQGEDGLFPQPSEISFQWQLPGLGTDVQTCGSSTLRCGGTARHESGIVF